MMSAEQSSLRLMLILAALSGAGWCAVRALRLMLDAHGTPRAGSQPGQLLLFGLGALVLCVLAVSILRTLLRALLPLPGMSPRHH